jgi:hypothetical protein
LRALAGQRYGMQQALPLACAMQVSFITFQTKSAITPSPVAFAWMVSEKKYSMCPLNAWTVSTRAYMQQPLLDA